MIKNKSSEEKIIENHFPRSRSKSDRDLEERAMEIRREKVVLLLSQDRAIQEIAEGMHAVILSIFKRLKP